MASPLNRYNLGLFDSGTYYPYACDIEDVTKGSTTLIETSIVHSFVVGNQVQFSIPSDYGMRQLNAQKGYVIAVPDDTTIIVDIDSRTFDNFVIPTPPEFVVIDPAQVAPIGDCNFGKLAVNGFLTVPQTIPGAYYNTPP